jgi:N-acetylglutamate synthase-like GNAT family acetyltransferase
MSDPRTTGISSITGKMVSIRHATGRDLVLVDEYLRKNHANMDRGNADVVVAEEDVRIIGFGILKKENDEGCVSLFEDSRRKGIGSSIVKHLIAYAPVKKVYGTRYATYFTRSGRTRAGSAHASRRRKASVRCRAPLMERLSLAAYER